MTAKDSSLSVLARSARHSVLSGLGLCLVLGLGACGGGDHDAAMDEAAGPQAAASQPAASAPANGPSAAPSAGQPADQPAEGGGMDLAPRSSRGGVVASAPGAAGATALDAAGITFDLPDSWQQQPPSNSMRMAQASIPGSEGAAEFTAFFFGPGGGGGTEANLQRWAGQIAAEAAPKRETFSANGLTVHWIEVFGTLQASAMMGMGPGTDQPNSGLYGAVVEGPGGPWFFKVTGPRATLEGQREAFRKMLEGVRPQHSA